MQQRGERDSAEPVHKTTKLKVVEVVRYYGDNPVDEFANYKSSPTRSCLLFTEVAPSQLHREIGSPISRGSPGRIAQILAIPQLCQLPVLLVE